MDPEDYPSDSDASDEDFCPDKESGNSGSEVESDDSVEDHIETNDEDAFKKKRKRKTKTPSKKKSKLEINPIQGTESAEVKKSLDEDDEKRLTDALWADFLAGNGNNSSSSTSTNTPNLTKKQTHTTSIDNKLKKHQMVKPSETTTITKIFEFAGEAVEVTEEIPKNKIDTSTGTISLGTSNAKGGPSKPFVGRTSGGGLGAVLSQIGKKNKLSTLEKSKLDWNSFKRSQGIEEELQTHNKGKDGYLERQDFLQRADLRQFEIEKSFRHTTRSNR